MKTVDISTAHGTYHLALIRSNDDFWTVEVQHAGKIIERAHFRLFANASHYFRTYIPA